MKKLLLAFATALLIPGMLGATTQGEDSGYAPGRVAHSPALLSFADVSLILHHAECDATALASASCGSTGDYPLVLRTHPASGDVRGTSAPGNELFPVVGSTSILCPELIERQEGSVGVRSIVCAERLRFVAG